MNTELKFNVEYHTTSRNGNHTARVISVRSATGEDFTARFMEFCEAKGLSLTGEAEITKAVAAFSHRH